MTDEIKLQDGKVTTTVEQTVDLASFITQQQAELRRIALLQNELSARATKIVSDLQNLIQPEAGK